MIYLNEDLQKIVQAIRNLKPNGENEITQSDNKYLFDDLKDIADAIRGLNPEQTNEILEQTNETPETLSAALDEIITAIENIDIGGGGITVNESYDISEGTLNSAAVELEGDVTAHIPDGVTTIGNKAFMNNAYITKVVMPDSVTTMEDGVFQYPGSSNNELPFSNCVSLKEIVFSNNLNNIAVGTFSGCTSLTSITIPDSVTSIGNYTFNGCTSLTSVVISDSVTSIGSGAFNNCTSLTDIYYTGTQAEWEAIAGISGAGIPEGATIHYEYTPE